VGVTQSSYVTKQYYQKMDLITRNYDWYSKYF
jgi:hypothetical protein